MDLGDSFYMRNNAENYLYSYFVDCLQEHFTLPLTYVIKWIGTKGYHNVTVPEATGGATGWVLNLRSD